MNLFAITSNPEAPILRFPLTAVLQTEVEAVFLQQLNAFLHGLSGVVEFDGRYMPDPDELLNIADFPAADALNAAAANPVSVDQYDPQVHSLGSVKALFTHRVDRGVNRIVVQLFEQRRLLSTGRFVMFFSNGTMTKMTDEGLALDTKVLALIEGRRLMFKNFHQLRRVFNMDAFFKEATKAEVEAFAAHAKISVANPAAFVSEAGHITRKKIALIAQSGNLERYSASELVELARQFKLDIKTTADGKIVLPSNKTQLRNVLRFLDEDYYTSTLSSTNFVSSSKRKTD